MTTTHTNLALVEGELWKDIIGFEGKYKISSLGKIINTSKNKELKHSFDGRYNTVSLNSKKTYIHKLLCIHFKGNPNGFPYVNHIDGNKTNNNLSNLEWCNASMNTKHAYDTGLRLKGKEHNFYKNNVTKIKVINTTTGVVYDSIREASKHIGRSEGSLARSLRNNTVNNLNLKYFR